MINDKSTIMKQKKTRTKYFTPAGKTMQSVGLMMFIVALFGFLVVKITSWFNVDTNWFVTLAITGYNVWLLGEVLCLYGGHWSKRTQVWLIITTIVVCLSLLLIALSLFRVGSPGYIILILLIGNIMEYRVAGRMKKESQESNEQ
jgi:hypothetical protein